MLKAKRFLGIIIIAIILLFNIYTSCYASEPVIEENLDQSFDSIFESLFEGLFGALLGGNADDLKSEEQMSQSKDKLDLYVDGTKIQVEYNEPSLNKNDIAEIEKEVKEYVKDKETTEHDELKKETIEELENEINLLIKEKEEEKKRDAERDVLRQMEKEYRKNKIPNAGDTTMLVLKTITVVSIIALVAIIVCNKKIKK